MLSISRQNSFAVLLILLVSYAALTWHVSTHMPVDRLSCEFCTEHADPSHAIPPAAIVLPGLRAFFWVAVSPPKCLTPAHPAPYRQRGPPITS